MTPFEQAQAVYEAEPCARSFAEDLWHHFEVGYVFSTPRVFVMGRPVRREWAAEWVREPWRVSDFPDCWHVWLLAGEWRAALGLKPFRLRWISFERRNVIRCYEFGEVERRILRYESLEPVRNESEVEGGIAAAAAPASGTH